MNFYDIFATTLNFAEVFNKVRNDVVFFFHDVFPRYNHEALFNKKVWKDKMWPYSKIDNNENKNK